MFGKTKSRVGTKIGKRSPREAYVYRQGMKKEIRKVNPEIRVKKGGGGMTSEGLAGVQPPPPLQPPSHAAVHLIDSR